MTRAAARMIQKSSARQASISGACSAQSCTAAPVHGPRSISAKCLRHAIIIRYIETVELLPSIKRNCRCAVCDCLQKLPTSRG
jgi:hypothetical protein